MAPEATARHVARVAASLDFDALPPRAVSEAKTAVLDVVGVMVAGARSDHGRRFGAYFRGSSAPGRASVVGEADGRPASQAALANGTFAHILDFDDRGHASTHLFSSLLAVAETRGGDGKALLRAYVLGREFRVLLDGVVDDGRMDGRGPGSRGWHSTGVNGPIASALASALLMNLDSDAIAGAVGSAASSSSGLIANFGTPTKPLHAGRAAADGVVAAELAEAGLAGDPAAIDGPAGLFDALGVDRVEAAARITERYGRTWDLVERGVRIKPYPSCTTTHPGIETALRLARRNGSIPLDEIERVTMDLRPFMLRRARPTDALEARFNMAHGVLTALTEGACSPADYSMERVAALRGARGYDRVIHEEGAPSIVVTLRDGSELREPLAPLRNLDDAADIVAKFHACTEPAWSADDREGVEWVIANLEGAADLRELGAALRRAGT